MAASKKTSLRKRILLPFAAVSSALFICLIAAIEFGVNVEDPLFASPRAKSLLAVLLYASVTATLFWLVEARVIRPLAKIDRSLSARKTDAYSIELAELPSDEIGRLARTLDSTLEQLIERNREADELAQVLRFQKMSLESVSFDALQAVEEICALHAASARGKGLDLARLCDPEGDTQLVGDPVRVRQVPSNLIGNAVKFTSAGNVTVKLSFDEHQARFEVSDTGIGIKTEDLDRLFRSFSQANSTTSRTFGGSGLGLSICKRLVELMDGEIGVRSEPGCGSTFWVEIPRTPNRALREVSEQKQELRIESPRPPAAEAAADKPHPYSALKVLVVDDNLTNRMIATRLLIQRHRIQAQAADSGDAALELLKAEPYDLVFMDCMMPNMDGYAATAHVRNGEAGEANRDVPIVALTANALSEDRRKCIAAGMSDYLSKPISPAELARLLAHWSNQRHLATETEELHDASPSTEDTQLERDAGVLDLSKLQEIYDGDTAIIHEMLTFFEEGIEESMKLLIEAVELTKEEKNIRFYAHRIRGSSAEFGAVQLSEITRKMEELCLEDQCAEAAALLPSATSAAEKVKQQIAAILRA